MFLSSQTFLQTVIFSVIVTQVIQGDGARILGIFVAPTFSHYILGHKLLKELSLKGHEVTLIHSFSKNDTEKNYREIPVTVPSTQLDGLKKNILLNAPKLTLREEFAAYLKFLDMLSDKALNNTNMQNLLKSNQTFDLVIISVALNEAYVGIAHHYNAPLILLSTLHSNIWTNHYVGNPAPVSYVPVIFSELTGKMSFIDRMKNTFISMYMHVVYFGNHFTIQNEILHKYFPDAPEINEIIKERMSLLLMNSHSSFTPAKPIVPNMVEIGGYHIDETTELPMDIKKYLDNATNGFVLFSMGSLFKGVMFSEEMRNIFMKAFSQLPYKVLWKFEEDLQNIPNNVRIEKWLPQTAILAHPNIKLFITHGGLLSTTEAVYFGVPIVGIPAFGDQKSNMATAESFGIGKVIQINELTLENFLSSVQEVLNNKIYQKNARERSKMLRDQPLKPIDNAIFWVEYVLRHKNLRHLRTGASELEWYQIILLDVIVVLVVGVLLISYISYWIIKKLFSLLQKLEYRKRKIQ